MLLVLLPLVLLQCALYTARSALISALALFARARPPGAFCLGRGPMPRSYRRALLWQRQGAAAASHNCSSGHRGRRLQVLDIPEAAVCATGYLALYACTCAYTVCTSAYSLCAWVGRQRPAPSRRLPQTLRRPLRAHGAAAGPGHP